ncbi:MAG: DJ-1/PfpI family protein [Mycoplasmataceae bacterium]|nr:DJ-1/PfpI family protein [Mycoplasmataceae bacterium]
MKKIAVLVANKSEEIEVVVPIDIWKRAGLFVKTISIEKKKNVVLARGTKLSCDTTLDQQNLNQFHAIFIPGGAGYIRFNTELGIKVKTFVQKSFTNKDTWFLAICAAPSLFAHWNVLGNNKITCHPDIDHTSFIKNYVNKDVVVSHNFITANAPGTAHTFAFKVVENLVSNKMALEVKKQMLY